jgi:hypothetical protein
LVSVEIRGQVEFLDEGSHGVILSGQHISLWWDEDIFKKNIGKLFFKFLAKQIDSDHEHQDEIQQQCIAS